MLCEIRGGRWIWYYNIIACTDGLCFRLIPLLLVLQIYPENVTQTTMLSEEAMKVGFSGGLVVDYPHSTRAKKYYLCLMVGAHSNTPLPPALQSENEVAVARREGARGNKRRKVEGAKGKAWILKKKDQMRQKGYVGIAPDTKYTGRKRKSRM
jgi:18S rRNA (guanine1575-N7)-methyltransferase